MAVTNILGVSFYNIFILGSNFGGRQVVEYALGEVDAFLVAVSIYLLIKFLPNICLPF